MSRRVIITKDRVSEVIGSITHLVGKEVLVGIPDSTTDRDEEEAQPMTNATLGYIHEFGSPAANIPARPFLIPGVHNATREIMPHLKGAAKSALDGKKNSIDRELMSAGMIAQGSARREITTGNFVPLKPATVAARFRKRGTKKRRAAEDQYLQLIDAGVSPAEAQEQAGIRPLIDTGKLRQAITFVVRAQK